MSETQRKSNGQVKGAICRRPNGLTHFYPIPERTIEYHRRTISISKIPINLSYLQKRDPTITERLDQNNGKIGYSLPLEEFQLIAREYTRREYKRILDARKEDCGLVDIITE